MMIGAWRWTGRVGGKVVGSWLCSLKEANIRVWLQGFCGIWKKGASRLGLLSGETLLPCPGRQPRETGPGFKGTERGDTDHNRAGETDDGQKALLPHRNQTQKP